MAYVLYLVAKYTEWYVGRLPEHVHNSSDADWVHHAVLVLDRLKLKVVAIMERLYKRVTDAALASSLIDSSFD